jgi:GNAT superfamily N-acetyltransferase
MEIKTCTKNEYSELLDLLNTAFDYGVESQWFQKNVGNCTPVFANDAEIACHWLCYIDGKMAGALGAYPLDWVAADDCGISATIKAYGIGQVCCLPQYRNRGVMTALMNASEKHMRENGRVLGFLGGDRHRYANYGYDIGGNAAKYWLSKHRFMAQPPREGLTVRQAGAADIAELDGAYNALPARVLRGPRMWALHISRENIKFFIGERDGRKAYLAYEKPEMVFEVYGDPSVGEDMLKHLITRHSLDGVNVNYPMQNGVPDAMGRMLYGNASWVSANPLGMVAVVDGDGLCDSLAPLTDVKLTPAAAFRMMGYCHRAMLSKGDKAVAPLNNWVSEVDFI